MSSRYFFQFVVCLLNLFVMFTELCRHFRVLCGLIYHFKNDSQVSRHVQKCVSHSAIRKFILPSPFQSFMVLFLCDLNLIDLEFIGIWSEIEIQLYLFPDGRSWVPTLSLKVLFFSTGMKHHFRYVLNSRMFGDNFWTLCSVPLISLCLC